MTDATERARLRVERASLRARATNRWGLPWLMKVDPDDLLVILDAADERDRLAALVRDFISAAGAELNLLTPTAGQALAALRRAVTDTPDTTDTT